MKVSAETEDILIADEIGSGMAIAIYDPVARVGGLLHFLLPDSVIERKIAEKRPFIFADTAIPLFFKFFCENGGDSTRAKIFTAGGSQIMDQGEALNIGNQNHKALRSILDKAGTRPEIEDVGGHVNRGMKIIISTGEILIKSSRSPYEVKV